MTRAIEESFPSKELSIVAELESWRKEVHRPTYHMHKWWATRLGSVFRAILIGALSENGTDIWQDFYRAVRFPEKVVFDPFMGSGTTIGEALKLGCKVVGSDINPISVFQVRKALSVVKIDTLMLAFQRVEARVKSPIQAMYTSIDPATNLPADILYCFWVMIVTCPLCNKSVDLFDTSIFAKNAYPERVPEAQSVCFHCGWINTTRFDATQWDCAGCGKTYNPQHGTVQRNKATCPYCYAQFKIVEAISLSQKSPAYRLYALFILTVQGEKKYIPASEADKAKIVQARDYLQSSHMLLPTTCIEPGHNTNQILRYNYTEWRQLFNERQLELSVAEERGKKKGLKVIGLSSSPIATFAQNFNELNQQQRALLFCTDSAHVDLPDASIDAIITDPPYFDFVHYSELADFFFAWLRLGRDKHYPEFRASTTRHAQEVQQKDVRQFSVALQGVFLECRRVLKPDGILAFSFHRSRNEGWVAVGEAIMHAGLSVVATHPIKAELAVATPKSLAGSPINYDAILVCKHRTEPSKLALTTAVDITLERTWAKMLNLLSPHGTTRFPDGDLFVIMQAEALCTFSQHAGLLSNDSGSTVSLSTFLECTAARLNSFLQTYREQQEESLPVSITSVHREA